MRLPGSIVPHYFGPPAKRLYGCFHGPAHGRTRNCAVVICQPCGHEYVNCHRALRHLAARLCDIGFPVLRFDYYACGDSPGCAEQGTFVRWMDDVSMAISDVRQKTNLAKVCVIGLRLGGTLSMLAGAERGDIESVVLWDPIITGTAYLGALLSLQKEMLRFRPKLRDVTNLQDCIEVLGFPWPRSLWSEIDRVCLLKVTRNVAKNILFVHTDSGPDADRLKQQLNDNTPSFEYQKHEAPRVWLPTADGGLPVPSQLLQSVVSWVTRKHA